MKFCPKCKFKYDENYSFCKKCGEKLIFSNDFIRKNSVNNNLKSNKNVDFKHFYYAFLILLLLVIIGFGFYYFNNSHNVDFKSESKNVGSINSLPKESINMKDNVNILNRVDLNLPLKNNEENKSADNAINNYFNKIEFSSQNSVGVKDSFAFISGQDVRFRKTPNGEVIGSFNRGDKVTILDRTGNWYNIRRSDGVVGYVSVDYCKILYKDAPAHITGTDVRFRKYPDGQILGYFDKGEKVIVLNRTGKWYGVIRKNGSVGYVHIDYCKINDEYCPF